MKKVSLFVGISLMLIALNAGLESASAASTTASNNSNSTGMIMLDDSHLVTVDSSEVGELDDLVFEQVTESEESQVPMPVEELEELVDIEPADSDVPNFIQYYGTRIPTKRWNVGKKRYSVAGRAYKKVIYTNYLLHGSKRYRISLTNRGPQTVKVQFKTKTKVAKNISIRSRKNVTVTVRVGNANTNYYLRFSGNHYDVVGTVQK